MTISENSTASMLAAAPIHPPVFTVSKMRGPERVKFKMMLLLQYGRNNTYCTDDILEACEAERKIIQQSFS